MNSTLIFLMIRRAQRSFFSITDRNIKIFNDKTFVCPRISAILYYLDLINKKQIRSSSVIHSSFPAYAPPTQEKLESVENRYPNREKQQTKKQQQSYRDDPFRQKICADSAFFYYLGPEMNLVCSFRHRPK